MKYLKQFLIIVGISCVGELLKILLPLPVPASIYGMIILFAGLCTEIISLDSAFAGVTLSLIAYMIGMFLKKKFKISVLNPLMVSIIITIVVLVVSNTSYETYNAEPVCKIFKIKEPIAKGVAIGSAAHAIGTAKAMELGEIEGAMSSLSIAVAGLFTVIGASLFSYLI